MGFFDFLKKIIMPSDTAAAPGEYTPATYNGLERSYHYTDVVVRVLWQFGGMYGKSCASAGMRRGQTLELLPKKHEGDKDAVLVRWQNQNVALMRSNRMRNMVRAWMDEGLPVLAKAYEVGGDDNLLIEVAFYGKAKRHSTSKKEDRNKYQPTPELACMCEKQFIAFDLETTGLDAEDDRIIEIAAVKFVDCKATESFATLVNCGMPIPEDASAVNNITDDDVEDAPDEAAALKQFADFLGDDALKGKIPLVAHNAAFDSSFLKTAFRRCEITTRMKFADTLALSQRRLPKLENHKLQTVAQALDIQQQQAHRAEDDARVCGEVMAALLTKWIGEERERFNALLPEEQAACLWIYKTLKRQRCNIDHLSFSPSAYLTVNCWHKVLRIKIRAKTPYILVDDTITLPEGTVTAPATQTDGSGLIRVLYNNLEDLDWLQSWIATVYKKVSEETAAAWKVPKTQKDIQAVEDAQVRIFV